MSDEGILGEQSLSGSRNVNNPQEDPSCPIKRSPISTQGQLYVSVLDTQRPPEAGGRLTLMGFSGTNCDQGSI